MKTKEIHIAIFASGTGSNAVNIINYFGKEPNIRFTVLSNNPKAPVLEKAQALGIDTLVFNRKEFNEQQVVLEYLKSVDTELIILAGFLWLVPEYLVKAYPKKIINIHPALLPNYGGKGMYGLKVHKAVIEAGDKESGITIHFVDEIYDHGDVIVQEKCSISDDDTPETLVQKIHALEHEHFPKVIENIIKQ
ncbi:phosphoribosylglycinamide formyltransferase [Flammeovirgaceae bacterium SG7u.111]|nr:phosphoribosylglycinamide formyltransferase [Flammeovirgaceae bacterium SG7u.132]WPO35541.1 phosphoribosylglycinamide formyltransferase [Flammeovirgaceae bacterium SG7u.111]